MPFMPVSNETKERADQFVESIERMADQVKYYKNKFQSVKGIDKAAKKLIDEMMDELNTLIGKVPEMNRSGDYIKKKNECCVADCDEQGCCYREEKDEWYCTDCYTEYIDDEYEEPTLGIKETKLYMDAYRQSLCPVKEFVVEKKVKRVLPQLTKNDVYEKNGKPHCKCPLCDCEMTVRHYIDNHPKILKCTHIKQVRVSDVKKALEAPAPVVATIKKERKKTVKKVVKKEKTPEPEPIEDEEPMEESVVDIEDRTDEPTPEPEPVPVVETPKPQRQIKIGKTTKKKHAPLKLD